MKPHSQHISLSQRFETLRPRLKSWASRLLGSPEDADDALQDAFFRLWRQKDRIDNQPLSVDALSMTALRSACIDTLRKREIRRHSSIETADTALIAENPQVAEMADMAEEVKLLIDRCLDPRSKEVLMLHDYLGYGYDEIATRLNISEANARLILSRTRKTIRDQYRKRCR